MSLFTYEPDKSDLDKASYLRWINIAAFLAVIILNALASTGKITGKSVGDVSDLYQTDITPASYAFSIWALIYFLVAVFCIFQALPQQQTSLLIFGAIGWWFVGSCFCNVVWIIIFTFGKELTTWISTIFIFAILFCLVAAARRSQSWMTVDRTWLEIVSVDIMLSLYGGWVTVACVVNVSAAFVSSGVTELGWSAENWTIVMLVVAAAINLAILARVNDSIWGLVYTWATIAIANETPGAKAKTAAFALAGIVGGLSVLVGVYRIFKFASQGKARINFYTRPSNNEKDTPMVVA